MRSSLFASCKRRIEKTLVDSRKLYESERSTMAEQRIMLEGDLGSGETADRGLCPPAFAVWPHGDLVVHLS